MRSRAFRCALKAIICALQGPRNHVKCQQVMASIEAIVFRIKHIMCILLCKALGEDALVFLSRGAYLPHFGHFLREVYVSYH